jgi:hypothetical protein
MTDSTVTLATIVGVEVGSVCDPNFKSDCGGTASLSKVVVTAIQPDGMGAHGVGVQAEAGGQLTLDSGVLTGNHDVGLLVTDMGTLATVTNSIMRATGVGTSTMFGYGFTVLDGATATLSGSFVRDNLGVALAFRDSSAGVDSTVVLGNQVGVYATGATLEQADMQPDSLGAMQVVISQTQFIDNVTKVSSTDLPIPPVSKVLAPPPSP